MPLSKFEILSVVLVSARVDNNLVSRQVVVESAGHGKRHSSPPIDDLTAKRRSAQIH